MKQLQGILNMRKQRVVGVAFATLFFLGGMFFPALECSAGGLTALLIEEVKRQNIEESAIVLADGDSAQADESVVVECVEDMTNIVLVVDCSSSMRGSDGSWQIPASLNMLIDMLPNRSDIRVSMILYGTTAEIIATDELMDENGKERIKAAIASIDYNWGQTDTGKALQLAKSILEDRAGQNNRVILFTDGKIEVSEAARTAEDSKNDVNSFITFAQETNITVDAFGLFSADIADSVIEQAKADLEELCVKTGGAYQRIQDLTDLPARLQEIVADTLDVRTVELTYTEQTVVSTTDGDKTAYAYTFSIQSQLQNDVTIILPELESTLQAVVLQASDGTCYEIVQNTRQTECDVFIGADYITYQGKTGSSGDYGVIHLSRDTALAWEDDWTIFFVMAEQPTLVNAYYLYDVQIAFAINATEMSVMESSQIEIYLTTGDGIRVSDLDFIASLDAEISIINMQSMSVSFSDTIEAVTGDAVQTSATEQLTRVGDRFVYDFTPRYVADYYFVVNIGNDEFVRTATSTAVFVEDDLAIVCDVLPQQEAYKEQTVTIQAYLRRKENGAKIVDYSYYEQLALKAIITRVDVTPTQEVASVLLTVAEDGTGAYYQYAFDTAGEYKIETITDSAQENLTEEALANRSEEGVSSTVLVIPDRPLQVSGGGKEQQTKFVIANIENKIETSPFFYDPDENDDFVVDVSGIDVQEMWIDSENNLYITPMDGTDLNVTLSARSYISDDVVSLNLKVVVLTVFEIIVILLVVLLVIAFTVWFVLWNIAKRSALKGVARVSVTLNDIPRGDFPAKNATRLQMGSYYIPLQDLPAVSEEERIDKKKLSFVQGLMLRKYALSDIVKRYMLYYEFAGYRNDPADQLMNVVLGDSNFRKQLGYVVGRFGGKRFNIQGVSSKNRMKKGENDMLIFVPLSKTSNVFWSKLQEEAQLNISQGDLVAGIYEVPIYNVSVRIEYYNSYAVKKSGEEKEVVREVNENAN